VPTQVMSDFGYVAHGVGLGASIAMPLGPMKILCLRRVIAYGALAGIVTAAGVVSGDTIFIAIAALGLSATTSVLHAAAPLLRIVGGLALLYLAVDALRRPIPPGAPNLERSRFAPMYAGTVALTLTNPTTIIMFATVLMSSGEMVALDHKGGGGLVPLGMVMGSTLVWIAFSTIAIAAGRALTPARLIWLNRAAAVLFFYFGVSALWSAWRLLA